MNLALRGLEATQHQVHELVILVQDQSQQIERLSRQIERQSQQTERMISKDKEQTQQIERQSGQIERLMSKDEDQSQQLERQSKQIERLSGEIERQSQQINRQSQEIEPPSQQLGQISMLGKEQSEQTERWMSMVHYQLPQQTEQLWPIMINQNCPTPFEWKIPNIQHVLLRSMSGTESLVSEPFNLFRCDYKYLSKIEIRFQSVWVSLLHVYIKVVPGEYDEFLSWPCKEKVRVTLVNQNTPLGYQGNKSKVIDFEKGQVPCSRPLRDDYHEYRLIFEVNLTDLPDGYYRSNDTIFITINRE